jgi:hypothetical protein
MAKSTQVPFVIQDNFVSVVVNGRPFQLLDSHPTFKKMVKALRAKKWAKVPDLVNIAQSISNRTHGNVVIEGGEVFYKGTPIDNSLTKMMLNLMEHNKPVGGMLKFMDNLYANPNPKAISGLYEFLNLYSMPITDDGCFVAYKRVKSDYTDCHTGTVDNHIGQVPAMPRRDVDKDSSNPCSRGFHFCSRAYLQCFSGSHLMAIKVNPKDVDEIPEVSCGKGRTWHYEVIAEVPNENYVTEDATYFQNPLITVGRDRNLLVKKLLALPVVKRLLARTERAKAEYKKTRRKLGDVHPKVEVAGLTKEAIRKASFGRLQLWFQRFTADNPALPGMTAVLLSNPTRPARITAKLTVLQVAKEMGLKASVVYKGEQQEDPSQRFIDDYLAAIMRLKDAPNGITYEAAKAVAA